MNQFFFFSFLLVSLLGYSQDKKDLLLERDHEVIIERLKFMDYLSKVAVNLKIKMAKEEQIPDSFYVYFKDSIIANNPIPNSNIASYLDYPPNTIPPSADEFSTRVFDKNAASLYKIIERYGYPSVNRLEKHEKLNTLLVANNIRYAPDDWKTIFKSIIKKENEKGNLTKDENFLCRIFLGYIFTEKELKESGGEIISQP